MIRTFFSRSSLMLSLALGFGIFLTSCNKDKENIPPAPVAALMAFNLAPDQQAISIGLDGNMLPGGPLGFGNYTGQYLNAFPGNRNIVSFNSISSESLDSSTYNFEVNKFYSLFVVGYNGSYTNIVSEDNYDSLTASSGKAYVRFINALPNTAASSVVLESSGTEVVNRSSAFGEVSPFLEVEPGNITIQASNEGGVDISRTISLTQTKAYTVLLMGSPNETDPARTAQIKFIENGTVTD